MLEQFRIMQDKGQIISRRFNLQIVNLISLNPVKQNQSTNSRMKANCQGLIFPALRLYAVNYVIYVFI